MLEFLPTPLRGAASPQAPREHLVPVAQPTDPGEVDVKGEDGIVSLTVRNGSLRHVVAQIAETQDLNIVFASDADTRVTASFDRLPWQQALDALLAASGYVWTDNQGVIFVTSTADAGAVAPRAGGRRVQVFQLDFAMAVDVDQAVKGLLSPAGASWIIESASDENRRARELVAVADYPANLEQVAEYIRQTDVPPRQVMIEARILQVDLTDECRNGINFNQITSFAGNQVGVHFLSPGESTPGQGMPNPGSSTASLITVEGGALNGIVEFLETTSDAKTLASPRLLTVSGQQARIQIGEKLGYHVTTTTQTSSLESVEFLNVGIELVVTPRVTRDGRVLMRIKPKVSDGEVVNDLPNESTTEVETDILLGDGCGVVIGGLITEDDGINTNKIPLLGDIPYVGLLFQRRQQSKERKELIVTLVPHIVPYPPLVAQREAEEVMRAYEPLTYGAIHRYPRPYEPRLPDTLINPRPLTQACATAFRHDGAHVPGRPILTRLPPVTPPGEPTPPPEELPPGEAADESLSQPTSFQ